MIKSLEQLLIKILVIDPAQIDGDYSITGNIRDGEVDVSIEHCGWTIYNFSVKGTYKDGKLDMKFDHLGRTDKNYQIDGSVIPKPIPNK